MASNVELAVRATAGSGAPFWYPAGGYSVLRYEPTQHGTRPSGTVLPEADHILVWSNVQGRLPAYARIDVSARYAFRWRSWDIVPYLSVVNATARTNIVRYSFVGTRTEVPDDLVVPNHAIGEMQLPLFPTIGIDVRF